MLNESAASLTEPDVAPTPDEPASAAPPLTLVVLAQDDALVCVDDVCAPIDSAT